MASEEELLKIANNFLLNSPPGEFNEVVTDVRALLPDQAMLNESAPQIFREYNTEQMVQVESPNNTHKVLITKFGEVADGEYLDPKGGQVISYDHIRQAVVSARPIEGELDASIEPTRSAFEKVAFDYCAQHYPHGTTTVYGKGKEITIAISSARFNPNNFWNGRWRSVWKYTIGSGEMHATWRVLVHYYEDGNVQLNTETSHKTTFTEGSSPEASAKSAIAAILKDEQTYQSALDTSYQTMGDSTFKALRRALPITRTKIDWNKIKSYKLGGDLVPGGAK